MYFSNPVFNTYQNILLVIPGRCGYAFNISINSDVGEFGSSVITSNVSLRENDNHYVSGFSYDPVGQMLYYVDKMFKNPGGKLYAVDMTNTMTIVGELQLSFLEQFTAVVATRNNILYVLSTGGNFIMRAIWSNRNFNNYSFKTLPPDMNLVSSAFIEVSSEDLYFTTNEENSKLVRTRGNQFCSSICGQFAYCESSNLICVCLPGYNYSIEQNTCEVSTIYRETIIEERIHKAEITIGIIFGITTLLAALGWMLFYWAKRDNSGWQPLLPTKNLSTEFDKDNL